MNQDLNQVARSFNSIAPNVDFWSLRLSDEKQESISVRQGVMQPIYNQLARGALLTVIIGDGCGYASSSDLSPGGLKKAAGLASQWAKQSAGLGLLKASDYPHPANKAYYETPVEQPWDSLPLNEKITLLQDANQALKINDRIVDWQAYLSRHCQDTLLTSSAGAHLPAPLPA